MKKLHTNKGFTLAELLIVVAIIGIMVAVAIPTFRQSTVDAKQKVTLNNLRAAYSQAVIEATKAYDTAGNADYTANNGGSGYKVVCKAAIVAGTGSGDDASPTFDDSAKTELNSQGLPFTCAKALVSANDEVTVDFVFSYNANGVVTSVKCQAHA